MKKLFQQHKYYTPILLFMAGFMPLAGALISQYGFGLYPCILCIYQRIPYAVIMVLAVIALLLAKKFELIKSLLILCCLAFVIDAGIAFFHTGVEYKWWTGTDKCSGEVADSLAALKAAIMGAPRVRCDDPQFEFILTMAGWNVLYALGGAAYCAMVLLGFKNEKDT